jgi:hypothetical protein
MYLLSATTPDIDIRYSDIDVLDDPKHDVYGLGGDQLEDWATAITLVGGTLEKPATPAHVATNKLMVAYLQVEFDNTGNPESDLHIFFVGEDEQG